MTRQSERDRFMLHAGQIGLSVDIAQRLLRLGVTLQRLAEAQCNGDWPADNRQREVNECPRCGRYWEPSTLKKAGCPDCRAQDRVLKALADYPEVCVEFQGDPRGCIMTLKTTDGREFYVP